MSDDYSRNYQQEAIDDQAGFDMHNDLASYYRGMKQIEMAWEDVAQRRQLFAHFGIRDEPHFYQVTATHDRYVQSPYAAQQYGGMDNILQLRMNAIQQMAMDQMQQRAQTDLAGEFAPVEGVDLDRWAAAQARIISGGTLDEILPHLGIDQAAWDRVSAEWNARMSRDTTATIATAYGKAFSGAGQGAFGSAAAQGAAAMNGGGSPDGEPPIPLERYVEIQEAQGAAHAQGRDANEVLASFGMNALEWSNVGMWWGQYLNKNMMLDGQRLFHRFSELTEFFKAKYASPSADGDLDY